MILFLDHALTALSFLRAMAGILRAVAAMALALSERRD